MQNHLHQKGNKKFCFRFKTFFYRIYFFRSFAPAESTILLLSSENGLLQEPLLKVSKKFSQQHLIIPATAAKNGRINSCNLPRLQNSQDFVIRNSLELEKQAMLNILASQKR